MTRPIPISVPATTLRRAASQGPVRGRAETPDERARAIEHELAESRRLIDVTRASLDRALDAVRPGNRLGDIGAAVQDYVESHGFSVVTDLCGHGIGFGGRRRPTLRGLSR